MRIALLSALRPTPGGPLDPEPGWAELADALCLCGALREAGIDVTLWRGAPGELDRSWLDTATPDALLLSARSEDQLRLQELAWLLRDLPAPQILCGPGPRERWDEALRTIPEAGCVLVSPSEERAVEVLHRLARGWPLEGVAGVALQGPEAPQPAAPEPSSRRWLTPDLGALASAERIAGRPRPGPLPLRIGAGTERLAPAALAATLLEARARWPGRDVELVGDPLAAPAWLEALATALRSCGPIPPWRCRVDPDSLHRRHAAALAAGGCRGVRLDLGPMLRGAPGAANRAAVAARALQEAGVPRLTTLLMADSPDSLLRGVDFALGHGFEEVELPAPGVGAPRWGPALRRARLRLGLLRARRGLERRIA